MTRFFEYLTRGWLPAALVCLSMAVLGLSQPTSAQQAPEGSEKLMQALRAALPDVPIEDVYAADIPGFYAVDLPGGQTLYGSADGRFMFAGDLYALQGGLVNLAENRRAKKRKALLDELAPEDMVVFSPSGETRTYVHVFTDVDCGYCRKLHQEMADINALGIEVRYLAYPRAGIGTPSHDKLVSAWCADNPNQAMTALKNGLTIPPAMCDNPTASQYELGQQVGVTGTPAIITADGRVLPGYMPAARLAGALGLQ